MDVTAREALERWGSRQNKVHDRDVLSMLLGVDPKAKSNLPIDHLPAYLVEMMAAGSSTTSHTGAFVAWALTQHPDMQGELRQELFDAYPDPSNMDLTSCQNLPFLDAVIRETMRMYPMIPGPLERHLGHPITVEGHTIPPGIIASTSAYTQGRLESVYHDASEWNPRRWLTADTRMKLNWIPFGYGSRACPGANLAVTELKSMTAAVFRVLKAVQPKYVPFEDELELRDVLRQGQKWCMLAQIRGKERPGVVIVVHFEGRVEEVQILRTLLKCCFCHDSAKKLHGQQEEIILSDMNHLGPQYIFNLPTLYLFTAAGR